ncbi:hypothetical protein OJ253_2423 [Cryptosporidium canis]|uniref:RRM domain-containing protein n=1 Tax=Cryptosporidium canis TaxID=195482 RepID=A0A9D5DJD1_9CRYT|nr:hypothetical protein OJ253_2423 [Cryptosporidium canis]
MNKFNEKTKTEVKQTRWNIETNGLGIAYRSIEFGTVPHIFDSEAAPIFLTSVILTVLGMAASDSEQHKLIDEVVESKPSCSEGPAGHESNSESLDQNKYLLVTFSSEIYSLICLKLNGLVILPHNIKILCRIPTKYLHLIDVDILNRFIIPRIQQCDSLKDDEKCILKNLPADVNEEKIRQELENIGKLRSLTIIYDPTTGAPKGVGSFEFEESSLCKKAIALLHGKPIQSTKDGIWDIHLGSGIIANSNSNTNQFNTSNFTHNSNLFQNTDYIHISEIPTSMTYKVFSNPVLGLMMKYSKQIGETPSQIIQLLNIFLPEELIDDEFYNSTLKSIRSEAEVYGTILEIMCPRPNTIEEFNKFRGAGKVFIYFSDITAARRARYQFNGRVFDNIKTVSATFYPLEKYLNHEYSIISYYED